MIRRAVVASALLVWVSSTGPAALAADPSPSPAWTAATVAPVSGQPAGYLQYQKMCAICHGPGPGKPGTRALSDKYDRKVPALLAERKDLTAAFVKFTVRHGVSVMPPFRKTELSEADLDALAGYLTRKRR